MKQVITIKVDGTTEVTEPAKKPTLEEMQSLVGGYIEPVRNVKYNGQAVTMVVNEEGLGGRLLFNPKASLIARRTIVGDVLLLRDWRL